MRPFYPFFKKRPVSGKKGHGVGFEKEFVEVKKTD